MVVIIKEIFKNINETFFNMDFKVFYNHIVSYLVDGKAADLESHPKFDIIRSTANCAQERFRIIGPSCDFENNRGFMFDHYEIYSRKDASTGLSTSVEYREDSFSTRSLNEQLTQQGGDVISLIFLF